MEIFAKFFKGIGIAILLAVTVALTAFLSGTILWLIWPYAFPVVFPKAVEAGIILAKIPWWSSVCLVWVCTILIKGSTTTKD